MRPQPDRTRGMRMKILTLILFAIAIPSAAHAQILKCVGAGGRVEFAAACPPGTKAENTGIRNTPSTSKAAPAKSLAEREADFKKRQTEQQEAAKKSAAKETEASDRAKNCENAQGYLKSLQSGGRIARTDPKTGERVFVEDTERAAELERAQRAVDSNCN